MFLVLQGKVCNCPMPKRYYEVIGSVPNRRRHLAAFMVTGHSSTKDVSDQGSMWPAWSRNLGRGLVEAQRWLSSKGEDVAKRHAFTSHGFKVMVRSWI